MNSIKKAMVCIGAAGAAMLAAATPVVSNVTMAQSDTDRLVTITYSLSEDAVVTLDVLTNATPHAATGWASIGGAAICNAKGAVWRKVTSADANGQGKYTITWRPDRSWTNEFGKGFIIADGCAKAVVTAWALDNTPNYMVVDISAGAQQNTQRYYQDADFVPGGVSNDLYKKTTLLMRKIMAKDVTWTMGSTKLETQRSTAEPREATHQVTLTNNYYIGVYEVTQTQWALIQTNRAEAAWFNNKDDRAMRPVEYVCYNEIRNAANSTSANSTYNWPKAPNPGSFLGILRDRTGLDFDLPGEAQWEFAARAGNGDTKWGDGTSILDADKDANLDLLGRYKLNGGNHGYQAREDSASRGIGATNATAIVGSYAPNSWGLYDTAGNVWEWCLDWYEDDIRERDGKVNINPDAPAKTLSGANGSFRIKRGGSWWEESGKSRPALRDNYNPETRGSHTGFRVVCTAGLQ